MFYLMDISLSYYAQPLQQLLADQDFWPTVAIRHDWSRGAAAGVVSATREVKAPAISDRGHAEGVTALY
jgi:hypothetical protein